MKFVTVDASYAHRCGAFIADILFLDLFVLAPLGDLILRRVSAQDPWQLIDVISSRPDIGALVSAVVIAAILISLCYFAFFEWILGQTLGMALLRLRVIGPHDSLGKAIVRHLFIIPFPPFQLILLVDVLHLFYSDQGQRLTERLAGTKVVMDVALPE